MKGSAREGRFRDVPMPVGQLSLQSLGEHPRVAGIGARPRGGPRWLDERAGTSPGCATAAPATGATLAVDALPPTNRSVQHNNVGDIRLILAKRLTQVQQSGSIPKYRNAVRRRRTTLKGRSAARRAKGGPDDADVVGRARVPISTARLGPRHVPATPAASGSKERAMAVPAAELPPRSQG